MRTSKRKYINSMQRTVIPTQSSRIETSNKARKSNKDPPEFGPRQGILNYQSGDVVEEPRSTWRGVTRARTEGINVAEQTQEDVGWT